MSRSSERDCLRNSLSRINWSNLLNTRDELRSKSIRERLKSSGKRNSKSTDRPGSKKVSRGSKNETKISGE